MATERRSRVIAGRALARLGEELEAEYRQDRAEAAERLHNGFCDAINETKPSLETVLYVLEMLRHRLVGLRHEELFGPGTQVAVEEQKPGAVGHGDNKREVVLAPKPQSMAVI